MRRHILTHGTLVDVNLPADHDIPDRVFSDYAEAEAQDRWDAEHDYNQEDDDER